MPQMSLKDFLNSSEIPSLEDYPLDECALAIETLSKETNFLEEIADHVKVSFELAQRWRVLNVPVERCAREVQTIAANTLAYSHEKNDSDGRLRTLSNILNSARTLWQISNEVRNAVRKVAK